MPRRSERISNISKKNGDCLKPRTKELFNYTLAGNADKVLELFGKGIDLGYYAELLLSSNLLAFFNKFIVAIYIYHKELNFDKYYLSNGKLMSIAILETKNPELIINFVNASEDKLPNTLNFIKENNLIDHALTLLNIMPSEIFNLATYSGNIELIEAILRSKNLSTCLKICKEENNEYYDKFVEVILNNSHILIADKILKADFIREITEENSISNKTSLSGETSITEETESPFEQFDDNNCF